MEEKKMLDDLVAGVREYVRKDAPVVVQVGCSDAGELSYLRRHFPQGRYIGIDAALPCYPPKANGIEWGYAAVGKRTAPAPFFLHLETPALSGPFQRREGTVQTTACYIRLDELLTHMDAVPDVLIIDTEGSSYEVLEGAGLMLGSVNLMVAEVQYTPDIFPGSRLIGDVDSICTIYGLKLHETLGYASGNQANRFWVRHDA